VACWLGDYAETLGHEHEFRQRLDLQLLHHMLTVRLDGPLGGSEFKRNLLVESAAHDALENLLLSWS
jgi:hypothetical protein